MESAGSNLHLSALSIPDSDLGKSSTELLCSALVGNKTMISLSLAGNNIAVNKFQIVLSSAESDEFDLRSCDEK